MISLDRNRRNDFISCKVQVYNLSASLFALLRKDRQLQGIILYSLFEGPTPLPPAIIQLEPGVYTGVVSISASTLNPTAVNPLIIQGRPGSRARLAGTITVEAPSNTVLRGLILGGPVLHTNVIGSAVASCIVTGNLAFVQCNDSFIVGNTFDYAASVTATDPRLAVRDCTNTLVCDNIMLVSGSVAPIEESGMDLPDRDYNVYYPSNTLVPAEINGLYTDPLLHATLYCVTNLTSAVITSGVSVTGFDTDFYGNWRNPSNPCRGAIEVIFDGSSGGGSVGDQRDGGGRLIKRVLQGREQNIAYDGRNRLTSWGWSGSVSNSGAYVYDHAGRRVRTTIVGGSATTATRYVYDGDDVVTEYVDTDSDGAAESIRVYWLLPGMDQRIGFVDIVSGTPQFYYYLTDQVGTVLQIVDNAGTVVNQYDYDAWGNVRWGSSDTFETVENRYLFQGREYDRNGGFYYYRNRTYLPERGEFTSPDMNLSRGILGELDGMGTLAFCRNDPVNCTDPLRLESEWFPTDARGPGITIWRSNFGSTRELLRDIRTDLIGTPVRIAGDVVTPVYDVAMYVPRQAWQGISDWKNEDITGVYLLYRGPDRKMVVDRLGGVENDLSGILGNPRCEGVLDIWLNGQSNDRQRAALLGARHTSYSAGNQTIMIHNPTSGGITDTFQSIMEKLVGPSKVSRQVAEVLSYRANRNLPANLVFHSQRGTMGTDALFLLSGAKWTNARVEHHGSASNYYIARLAAWRAGVRWGGMENDSRDLVGTVIGFNSINPLYIARSILWTPSLFLNASEDGGGWYSSHHTYYQPITEDEGWIHLITEPLF
jgi:RHS repeat-associated protein